jgi:hypothetical protein
MQWTDAYLRRRVHSLAQLESSTPVVAHAVGYQSRVDERKKIWSAARKGRLELSWAQLAANGRHENKLVSKDDDIREVWSEGVRSGREGEVRELGYPDRVVVDQESEHGYDGEEDEDDFGSVSTAIERPRKAKVINRLLVSNQSRNKAWYASTLV